MIYADYDYYKSDVGFAGTKLTEAEFKATRKNAQAFVDRVTFHRIELWGLTEAEIPDYIRDAVCALCEKMQALEEMGGAGGLKTSESVGKQSVHYQFAAGATRESILMDTAMHYLHSTPFAYRGF